MNTQSRVALIFVSFTAAVASSLVAQGPGGAPPPPRPIRPAAAAAALSADDKVARGEFLVRIGSCNDCHTPWTMGPNGPEPDMTKLLSGHPQGETVPPVPQLPEPWVATISATNTAWGGPWGVSFTRNLTPDPETGIGKWTADEFVATIKTGRRQGRGRALLPPMPWGEYAALSEADLKAIYAYLMSIPAVSNKVPDPMSPAPVPAH
jgi:mono/diheme cytochrome c family protein